MNGLSYSLDGSGEKTLVFLHGFGGFKEIWSWQVEDISLAARVITIDLPGHGKSAWHGETLEDMADQVKALLDKEGIREAVFVASSFGGLVSFKLYEKYPEMTQGFVFVGSIPRFASTEDFPAGLDAERISKLAGQLKGDVGQVLDMFFRSLFSAKEREWKQYKLIKELRKGALFPDRGALLGFLNILATADLCGVAARVDRPVLFVLGDSDYICPKAVFGPLRKLMPSARIEIVPACGHFPFLSKPYEFNGLLKEFIGI